MRVVEVVEVVEAGRSQMSAERRPCVVVCLYSSRTWMPHGLALVKRRDADEIIILGSGDEHSGRGLGLSYAKTTTVGYKDCASVHGDTSFVA